MHRSPCFSLFAAIMMTGTSFLASAGAGEPTLVPLWPEGAPLAKGSGDKDTPALRIWQPTKDKNVGAGVVVCPGGGYGHLADDHEGKQIAEWLVNHGIAAFVLRYRIAPDYMHPCPLLDAQRALRWVRYHASEYGVDPGKIGIWGFSAGGHLASTASTHFDAGNTAAKDPIDKVSCRPDFSILSYPVISMTDGVTHGGSKKNLLGANPDPSLVESMSNEKQVTKETPPTFIFQTNEDSAVPAENAILYYSALRKAGVPAELHIYEVGRHGVGLAQSDPILSTWPDRLRDWLSLRGILPAPKKS